MSTSTPLSNSDAPAAPSFEPLGAGNKLPGDSGVFVILNPVAGSMKTDLLRTALNETFASRGIVPTIHLTRPEDNLRQLVTQALEQGHDLIVAAGGDGTIAAVADALVNRRAASGVTPTLGIIATGTANVLARELGLPLDPLAAARLLAHPKGRRALDVMRVQDRHFVVQIGLGLDALMIRDTPRTHKRRWGRLAYLLVGLSHLIGFRVHRFQLWIDDQPRYTKRGLQLVVANSGTLGQEGFHWGPNISPDDGVLNVCLVGARTWRHLLDVAWAFFRGRAHHHRRIHHFEARRRITLDSRPRLPVQADGEVIGTTPLTIELVPRALAVLC